MLENRYKTIKENEHISRGVCYLYPQELAHSETARYDQDLCLALINKSNQLKYIDQQNYGF